VSETEGFFASESGEDHCAVREKKREKFVGYRSKPQRPPRDFTNGLSCFHFTVPKALASEPASDPA
jgi:hypothetical protein